jgi:hypothetical protein
MTSEAPASGLADRFGPPGSPIKWNNTDIPEWAYRCEVTNYAVKPLFDVWFGVHLVFRTPEVVPGQPNSRRQGDITFEHDWLVPIPKIDPGPDAAYVFFVWNCCTPRFVNVSLPAFATAQIAGEIRRQRIKIVQPTANLFNPLNPNPWKQDAQR